MQSALVETVTGPGLYVLEAPMGQGKTEAALYAAYRLMTEGHNYGFYFALPTRLTSNRIHKRVNCFLSKVIEGDAQTRLIHAQSWIRELERGGEELRPGQSWFHPRKRALLMPFGVGTVDQALLSVLRTRHNFLRSFGLAGKVVILDEVHSYDVYTGTLLDVLVRSLLDLGCTVIVLSATLTHERRAALFGRIIPKDDSYPLITAGDREVPIRTISAPPPPAKEVRVTFYQGDIVEIARQVVERARSGQCVLWIANTVGTSQKYYRMVTKDARPRT